MDPVGWLWKKGSRLSKPSDWGNFSTSATWSTRPASGCGARSTSLWVHKNLFWQPSRDGNSHGSSMSHTMTVSLNQSFKASTRLGDSMVGRGNAGWTPSKSGHPCPCQNCAQGPAAEKTAELSLMSLRWPNLSREGTDFFVFALSLLTQLAYGLRCEKSFEHVFYLCLCLFILGWPCAVDDDDCFFVTCKDLVENLTIHSPPAPFFSLFFLVEISSCTPFLFFRPGSVHSGSASWVWGSIFWQVACEFISLIGSHTMPEQHCQLTPTLFGQGCMRV